MADQNEPTRNAQGVLQVHSGTPGFSGAILDAIKAISGALAPRAVTQIQPRINGAVDQASGAPQSLGQQF